MKGIKYINRGSNEEVLSRTFLDSIIKRKGDRMGYILLDGMGY